MAAIKFTGLVSDMKGSIGGSTVQGGKQGPIIRAKPKPAQKTLNLQQPRRGYFSTLTRKWSGLTQTKRDAWDAAAPSFPIYNKFGDLVDPSGFNLFLSLNINLNVIGLSYIDTPPTAGSVTAITSVSFLISESLEAFNFSISPTPVPTKHKYVYYAGPNRSPGVQVNYSTLRVIKVRNEGNGANINIWSDYQDVFGVKPRAGMKIFAGVVPVLKSTGQRLPMVGSSTIVLS